MQLAKNLHSFFPMKIMVLFEHLICMCSALSMRVIKSNKTLFNKYRLHISSMSDLEMPQQIQNQVWYNLWCWRSRSVAKNECYSWGQLGSSQPPVTLPPGNRTPPSESCKHCTYVQRSTHSYTHIYTYTHIPHDGEHVRQADTHQSWLYLYELWLCADFSWGHSRTVPHM